MFHELGAAGATGKAVVTRDVAKALALLERACGAGEPVACLNLAQQYKLGTNLPHNDLKAADLRRRALESDAP